MRKVFILLFLLSFNMFFLFANEVIQIPSSKEDKWYSTGVVYELFVKSFKDTNEDKYGDFKGVLEKLDYIKSLGVTAIWFMPIWNTPKDAPEYEPSDFMDVNPLYGTMDDFKDIIKACKEKNIKIILDFTINHTSDKHPFFIDAASSPSSKYRNWYVWRDQMPPKDEKWKGDWYQSSKEDINGYYYSAFRTKTKPDLNFRNKEVVEYMKKVIKFWLDLGVDGFRFDAIGNLVENAPNLCDHQPENFEVLKQLRKFVDDNYTGKDIFLVGEAASDFSLYFGNGKDIFHSVFNFKFNSSILRYVKFSSPYTNNGLNLIEDEVLKQVKDSKEGTWWGTLLSNHDLFVGDRPFQQLGGDIEKCKLAAALYLTMPGIPFVYYGEEVGMDTFTKPRNDKWLRCLMQWDDSNERSGFTTGKYSWNMANANYKDYNVKKFDTDPNSILNYYRNLIKTRVANKSLSLGSFQALKINSTDMVFVAYLREYKGEKTVVIHNFSKNEGKFDIELTGTILSGTKTTIKTLFGNGTFNIAGDKLTVEKLMPYQSVILKFE